MGGESRDVSTERDDTVSLLPERLEAASRPRRENLRLSFHSALQPTAGRETEVFVSACVSAVDLLCYSGLTFSFSFSLGTSRAGG